MIDINPHESDLILGGQNLTPINAAILGGLAGVKQRYKSESISERVRALNTSVQYGNDGINLAFEALSDGSEEVRQLAYKLLYYRLGSELLCDRLEELQKKELFRILASDSKTQTQLLKQLSKSSDLLTLRNLAGNPNTPSDILSKLGDMRDFNFISKINIEDFKKWNEIARIDPFCYMTTERTNRSPICESNMNLEEHYNWLINSGIPHEIVKIVRMICEIYQNVTKNPNAPLNTVLRLANRLQSDFIENPAWYKFAKSDPFLMKKNCPTYLQVAIAENIDTSLEGLIYLWYDCNLSVYKYIVAHPNFSIERLEFTFHYIQDVVREDYIHRQVPIHLHETQIAIAKNPKTPAHILEQLATYRKYITDERIKSELGRAIAEHPNNLK